MIQKEAQFPIWTQKKTAAKEWLSQQLMMYIIIRCLSHDVFLCVLLWPKQNYKTFWEKNAEK